MGAWRCWDCVVLIRGYQMNKLKELIVCCFIAVWVLFPVFISLGMLFVGLHFLCKWW